jgi:putative transposase
LIEALQGLAFKKPFLRLEAAFCLPQKVWQVLEPQEGLQSLQASKTEQEAKREAQTPCQSKTTIDSAGANQKQLEHGFLPAGRQVMSDSLMGIRKFRTFNVMDDCSREALAIEIDTSLSAKRIIRTLERIIEQRGKPKTIRTDNGPEFTSKDFELWCKDQGIENQYIQPGKPMQNGYIERFNRLYREAILDAYVFMDLEEVRYLTREWIEEYNYRRPHEALNNLTPDEWKRNIEITEIHKSTTVC